MLRLTCKLLNYVMHNYFLSVSDWLFGLGTRIGIIFQPVYVSKKLESALHVPEKKPPLVNQQCVVYKFKCDLCDADYVGYTCRHLHQRIDEHKNSVVGKHVRKCHREEPARIEHCFSILKKCQNKFDCLLYEMLFIRELKPKLNTQSDSFVYLECICNLLLSNSCKYLNVCS